MNEHSAVSLVSLIAILMFVGSGLLHHNVGWQKGLRMAALWAGIFAVVILFISTVR